MPQRFTLPPTGKAHCISVNGWVSGQQCVNLGLHVVVRRNDVKEVFDDAETEIGFTLVDWNHNPRLSHSPLSKHLQCKCAIPYAGMMTTIITGNRNDSHP